MSVLTLFLYLTYFILIILALILLTAILPLNITTECNVDGFIYNVLIDSYILLGLIAGIIYFDSNGGLFTLKIATLPVYTTKLVSEKKESEAQKTSSRKIGNIRILIKPLRKLISSISKRITFQVNLDVIAGLSDPYLTGLIFGILFPLTAMIENFSHRCSFSLTPVFMEEQFKGKLVATISLRVILLVYLILRFILSREYRMYRKTRSMN